MWPNSIIVKLVILILSVGLTSCISNRKLQYLQKPEPTIYTDSLLREYNKVEYAYKLQQDDQLFIGFESLTSKQFDFFNPTSENSSASVPGLLFSGKVIDRNGDVSFPFIGKVKLAGLTIIEAQDHLQKIASQYLDSPVVKISLMNFRVTFLGEVIKEGTIPINNQEVTLLEAIGWAGGLTDFAARDAIKIVRTSGSKVTVQYVNILEEDFINSPYYFIHPHDVIIVSPIKARPYLKYITQNTVLVVTAVNLVYLILNITRSN